MKSKKINIRTLTRTALLLALCIASQFLKNTSVYITGAIINAILIISVLSSGLFSGVLISIITPLTSWWITGSPLISAIPLLLPCIMLGNLIIVCAVWCFSQWLGKRAPAAERITMNDSRFRLVLTVCLVAAVLWAGASIAFLSTLSSVLQLGKTSPLIWMSLISSGGIFLFCVLLWVLCCRFPKTWLLIAGCVVGSVIKAAVMWLLIVKAVLPAFFPASGLPEAAMGAASVQFSITQLVTALLGSVLAVLLWAPLGKYLKKPVQ